MHIIEMLNKDKKSDGTPQLEDDLVKVESGAMTIKDFQRKKEM